METTETVSELIERGLSLFEDRQYADALCCFLRANQQEPQDAEILVDIGASLSRLNRPQEALEVLLKAKQKIGNNEKNWNYFVSFLLALNFQKVGYLAKSWDTLKKLAEEAVIAKIPNLEEDFSKQKTLFGTACLFASFGDLKSARDEICKLLFEEKIFELNWYKEIVKG